MLRFPSRHVCVLVATSIASAEGAVAQPAPAAAVPEGQAVAAEEAAAAEEGLPDEELSDDAEQDPARPPPPGQGVVWGVLRGSVDAEPLIEASVSVVGQKKEVLTDYDGRFRLELPPGVYALRFYYELHEPARFDEIRIEAGQVVRFDAKLDPEADAVDTIEVESVVTRATIEGEILTRQRSAAVGDSLGRTEMSKGPDRNAAQAAQRVVGANVVGGRFVYVRGLGERYTNALLNGVPLPSPEPDRAAVPLDLFPTAVVDSLTVVKTFTPDVPADFAGGSVRVETREIPGAFVLTTTLSGGYNTQTSFRERLTHRGGDLDWLGFDDGTRALPDGFPKYKMTRGAPKPDGSDVTNEDLAFAGRQVNSYMTSQRSSTPPDHGGSVVVGNGWQLSEGRKFGFLGSVNYNRSYQIREREIRRVFQESSTNPEGVAARDYRMDSGNENVTWGAFGSVSYRLHQNHELSLLAIHTTAADSGAFIIGGPHSEKAADISNTRLSYITRSLDSAQLSGEHEFPSLHGGSLFWNASLSHASREQPDTRDVVWQHPAGFDWNIVEAPEAGRHYFAEQGETQLGGGLDWTQPLVRTDRAETDSKLKVGGLVSVRSRDFTSRTLRYAISAASPSVRCPGGDIDTCTDALFVPGNINPTGGPLTFQEVTQPEDSYEAKLDVYAGYLMADLSLGERFRLILGERVEHTRQTVDPYDQFGIARAKPGGDIEETDLLPSISFVWSSSEKSKLRGSLTRTLARPQLRELAPFIFQDFFGGRNQTGNANLELTHIVNADVRYEYFPTRREVLAASIFFKKFDDPIEPIVTLDSSNGQVTYRNAEGATLYGVELEARQSLDFLHEALNELSVVTNLTLATSSIEIEPEEKLALTNRSRPLVNQAPYVFNFALDYTNEDLGTNARLLYNVVGPTIIEVGTKNAESTAGLDDAYLHPRHLLDLTFQQDISEAFEIKFSIKNLLNSAYKVTQGCGRETVNGVSKPKRGLFDSTWHLTCDASDATIARRYTEGVSLSLSGSYAF